MKWMDGNFHLPVPRQFIAQLQKRLRDGLPLIDRNPLNSLRPRFGQWWIATASDNRPQWSHTDRFSLLLPTVSNRRVVFAALTEDIDQHELHDRASKIIIGVFRDKLTRKSKSDKSQDREIPLTHIDEDVSYVELANYISNLFNPQHEEGIDFEHIDAVSAIMAAIYQGEEHEESRLRLFHVGYCRAFLIRKRQRYPLTLPHTEAADRFLEGEFLLNEFALHPSNHILNRVINNIQKINLDSRALPLDSIWQERPILNNAPLVLEKGDTVVLCTSQFAEAVDEDRFVHLATRPPQKAAKALVKAVQRSESYWEKEPHIIVLTWPTFVQRLGFVGSWVLSWFAFILKSAFGLIFIMSILSFCVPELSLPGKTVAVPRSADDSQQIAAADEDDAPATPTTTPQPTASNTATIPTATLIPEEPVPEPTVTIVPTNTPQVPELFTGMITLLDPPDRYVSNELIAFRWRYDGFLKKNGDNYEEMFEVFFWKEGQEPEEQGRGMAANTSTEFLTVNLCILDEALGEAFEPMQEYLWSVRIRAAGDENENDKIIYTSNEFRRFRYTRACGGTVPGSG